MAFALLCVLWTFPARSLAAAPAPSITQVSPSPVPAANVQQWISIEGSGFQSGASVTLTSQQVSYPIPATRIQFDGAGELQVYANLTSVPAAWTVQVTNPDGQPSNALGFTTQAPDPASCSNWPRVILGSAWNGVDVYFNGPHSNSDNPCQCVNLVHRFYLQTFGLLLPNAPVAVSMWAWPEKQDIAVLEGSRLLTDRIFAQHASGHSTTPPQWGDILVFSGHGAGHVGIVTGIADGRVYFVEQNDSPGGAASLPLQFLRGHYAVPNPGGNAGRFPGKTYTVKGWLHYVGSTGYPGGNFLASADGGKQLYWVTSGFAAYPVTEALAASNAADHLPGWGIIDPTTGTNADIAIVPVNAKTLASWIAMAGTSWSQSNQPPLQIPSDFAPGLSPNGNTTVALDPYTGLFEPADPFTGVTGSDISVCDYSESGYVSGMAPNGDLVLACYNSGIGVFSPDSGGVAYVGVPNPNEALTFDATPGGRYVVSALYGAVTPGNWLQITNIAAQTTAQATFTDGTVDTSYGQGNTSQEFFLETNTGSLVGLLDSPGGQPAYLWAVDPSSGSVLYQVPLADGCTTSAPLVAVDGGADVASGDCVYAAADGSLVARTDMQSIVGGGSGQVVGISGDQLEVLDLATGIPNYYPLPQSWATAGFSSPVATPDGQEVLGIVPAQAGNSPSLGVFQIGTGVFSAVTIPTDSGQLAVQPGIVVSRDGDAAEVVLKDTSGNLYGVFFRNF